MKLGASSLPRAALRSLKPPGFVALLCGLATILLLNRLSELARLWLWHRLWLVFLVPTLVAFLFHFCRVYYLRHKRLQ